MPTSNKNNFLLDVYQAYRRNDADAINNLVKNLPDPLDVSDLSDDAWNNFKLEQEKLAAIWQKVWISLGIIGSLAVIVVVVLLVLRFIFPPDVSATPIPEATANPTAAHSPSVVPATAVPATDVPPTDVPPTVPPTEVPNSALLTNPIDILPPLPGIYEKAWNFNEDNKADIAVINSDLNNWKSYTYPLGNGRDEKYLSTDKGDFEISYTLDTPLPLSADYEILVMDTPAYSAINVQYEVFADGSVVVPTSGTNGAVLYLNKDISPNPIWLHVGKYHFAAGQIPVIKVKIGSFLQGEYFSIDRLVIGLLPQDGPAVEQDGTATLTATLPSTGTVTKTATAVATSTRTATVTVTAPATKAPTFTKTPTVTKTSTSTKTATLTKTSTSTQTVIATESLDVMPSPTALPTDVSNVPDPIVEALPKPYQTVFLWDDRSAKKLILVDKDFISSKADWLTAENLRWGGSFQYMQTGWRNTIQVVWYPAQTLQPGKYHLYVWVPSEHATVANAEYYIRINGQRDNQKNPRYLNQAKYEGGKWAEVADLDLDEPSQVEVVMEVTKDTQGEIAIDAIALLKLQ